MRQFYFVGVFNFCRLAKYGDLIRGAVYKVLNEDQVNLVLFYDIEILLNGCIM